MFRVNFTLGIASFFLMTGALDEGKNFEYNRIITVASAKDLKKPHTIKSIALSEEASLFTAYKSLDARCLNKIYVMNNNLQVKSIIHQNQLDAMIMENSILTKLKEVI